MNNVPILRQPFSFTLGPARSLDRCTRRTETRTPFSRFKRIQLLLWYLVKLLNLTVPINVNINLYEPVVAHGTLLLHCGTGPVNLVFFVLGASACSSRSRPLYTTDLRNQLKKHNYNYSIITIT